MIRILSVTCISLSLIACTLEPTTSPRLTYDPSTQYPYGRMNPAAPPELAQFEFMIGHNDCEEERLNNATGEWVSGERSWDAYYYLDGFAVRDSGQSGGATNGNIRIFDPLAEQWHVTFFSTPTYGTGIWSGGMVEDRIELEQAQKAPGTNIDGVNRLTFYDISENSFNWKGEWISLNGSTVFPFWRISCHKVS